MKPVVKARPRFTTRSGKPVTFTPQTNRDAEKRIATEWSAKKLPTLDGPVAVTITLAHDKVAVNVEPAEQPPRKHLRGDIDNYAKLILDALNGVAWRDDRQIVRLTVEFSTG